MVRDWRGIESWWINLWCVLCKCLIISALLDLWSAKITTLKCKTA